MSGVEAVAPGRAGPTWRKILLFPLTRLLIALLFVVAAFIGRDGIANALLSLPRDAVVARAVITMLCVYAGYVAYVRLVERRPVRELHARQAPREFAIGLAVGFCMIAAVVGLLAALGAYRVEGIGTWGVLFAALVTAGVAAVWEELVFRGILFRIVEEGLGTWLALIVSAALFGMLHLGNDNASFLAALTTAGVAGVFLAGVYVLTRRLWIAMGAHYAANLAQGAVFGLPVSGRERAGFFQGTLEGPELLTGGQYGIEASLVTAVLGSAVALYVVRRAFLRGKFVGPMWKRSGSMENGGISPELST